MQAMKQNIPVSMCYPKLEVRFFLLWREHISDDFYEIYEEIGLTSGDVYLQLIRIPSLWIEHANVV